MAAGRTWAALAVYVLLAGALAVFGNFNSGPGEHDVAPWAFVLFAPVIPALLTGVGAVIGEGWRRRQS
jgi:hypothetical protein